MLVGVIGALWAPGSAFANDCTITQPASILGTVPTSITFANAGARSVNVYWLDYGGSRVLYSSVGPFGSYSQPTWQTHPWVVVDQVTGACVGYTIATATPFTYTVDYTPPNVTLDVPAPATWQHGTVTVSATATDNVGVDHVNFTYFDGTTMHSLTPVTQVGGTYTAPFNTTLFADHGLLSGQVYADAYDAAGNHTSHANTIGIDNTAPTVGLTAPTSGATITGATTLSANATDSTSGVDHVEFQVENAPGSGTFTTIGTVFGAGPTFPQAWNTTARPNGSYLIRVRAVDVAGNTSGWASNGAITISNPAEALDQQSTSGICCGGTTDGYFGQSFTAGITGSLTRVRVSISCTYGGPGATFSLYPGQHDSYSGSLPTPLVSQAVTLSSPSCWTNPFAASQLVTIVLAAPFPVTAGTHYTFLITGQGQTNAPQSNGDAYGGGAAYVPFFDLVFETYVVPGGPPPPPPTDYSVSTPVELQAALDDAKLYPGAATIHLAAGTYNIDSTIGQVSISPSGTGDNVTLLGAGANLTILDGQHGTNNVVSVGGQSLVTIRGVTIQNGGQDGILDNGNVKLQDSVVRNNAGVGIENTNVGLEVSGSTISGNGNPNVSWSNNGGLYIEAPFSAVNTTITGNIGHGIYVDYAGTGASLTNVTISGNTGVGIVASAAIDVTNTIIADNPGGDCVSTAPNSTTPNLTHSLGHNLAGTAACNFGAAGDLVGTAHLGPLQDNGGPTPTLLPSGSSLAIDAGDDAHCPATDQRGTVRPIGAHCDIGAVETPSAIAPDTTIDSMPGDGTTDGGTFMFSSPTAGSTFECAVDNDNFQPCVSPKTVYVTAGSHTFKVRAVFNGTPDPTPATGTWTQNLPTTDLTTARIDVLPGTIDTLDTGRAYTTSTWQILYATCAKLVNYPDAPIPDALNLEPEVATEIPTPTNGGRDYTFTIQSGFAFANGEAVTAQSFKDALLRVLAHSNNSGAADLFTDIVGAAAYNGGNNADVSGLTVNGNQLTISLVSPNPDILQRLATPFACPVPAGTPTNDAGAISGSGPYTIDSASNDLIVLKRNPHYGGTRPSPFAEERLFLNVDQLTGQARVLAGTSDYLLGGTAPSQTSFLQDSHASQFTISPNLTTWYLGMNALHPPFDNPALRRAISFALNRNALAAATPAGTFTPTDQLVPPGMPGFNDWLLYPYGGDLAQALTLAASAGVTPANRITAQLFTCNNAQCTGTANVIHDNLALIGIDVVIRAFPRFQQIANEATPGAQFDLFWEGWKTDIPDASGVFGPLVKTGSPLNFGRYSSAATDARIAEADQSSFDTRYGLWASLDRDLMSGDAPMAPALNGTSRDLFSTRIGCQVYNPEFGMDLARLCIGGPVSVSNFSMVADAPSAQAGAGVVDPKDIPVDSIPLQTLAQAAAPLHDVGLAGSPLHDVPLHDVGFGSSGGALASVLLSQMPLLGRSWAQVLAGTTLAGTPDQNVTFGQAQTVASAAIGAITLSQIDLSASPLHDVGLASLALGATPLHDVPILGASADPLVNWCTALAGPPINCVAASSLSTETMMSVAIEGAPLHDVPLHDIPLHDINFSVSPLHDVPLHDVNISGSPLHDVPLHDIVLASPLHDVPLHDIPLHDVPLHDIPLHDIPLHDIGAVANCGLVNCITGTLGDALAAGALLPTATLGDIAPELVGYTLGDLGGVFGTTTLGDIVPSLPGTFTFGDLLIALIDPATFAYEKLPFDTMHVQNFTSGGGVLGYTATFTLTGGTVYGAADVSATLPNGAIYLGGSKLQPAGGTSIDAPDPTVTGSQLKWHLTNVLVGRQYKLRFNTGTSLKLGPSQADAQVAALGQSTPDTSAPAPATITETLENGDTIGSATTLQPNKVYFGYINRSSDSDFYTIPAPPVGTRLTVRLGNLANDDDLVMYSPAAAPQLRASGIPGVPLQSPPVADEGLTSSDINTAQQPATLQDIHLQSSSVAGISANRGTTPESVQSTSTGTGSYTIQVSGYNGQTSDLPYTIRIEEDPPVPPPACAPRVFTHAGEGTAGTIPALYNANLNTIFVVDAKRIGDTYGATNEQNVMTALGTLAGRNDLGISGAVVSVDGNPTVQGAYDTWDGNPCDPALANRVVTSIGSIIDSIRLAHPSLKYVVMVGADDIVPMARVPDNTQIANERGFSSTFAGAANNEYYGSLYARNLLSDQPYGDIDPIALLDRQIYVPDLSLGRLVETPDQIISALTQYQRFGGVLNPTTSLTTGYDFLADGANAIAASFASKFGATNSQTLINETWTRADLIAKLFPTGAPSPGIVSLNAHFDQSHALPAIGNATHNESDLFSTTDIPASSLAGKIWFSMGCHAGFNVSDVIVGSSSAVASDWAQTLAGQGAVFGANTGYGLGDDTAVAYSERLMSLFASHLDGSMPVGVAWKQAIQDYWATLGVVSVYDEKVMEEATFYGLPMYGVGKAPGLVPLAVGVHASTASAPVVSPVVPDPITGTDAANFTVTPSFTLVNSTDGRGSYYRGDDGVMAVNYRPLIPVTNVPLNVPGKTLHGIVITAPGLQSTDDQPFDAVFERPTVDLALHEPEPVFGDTSFPSTIATVRSFGSPGARQQRGILATGQYFSDNTPDAQGVGVMRRWTQIAGKALYDASGDFLAPTILSSDALTFGTSVGFTVHTIDDTPGDSVKFVYVVFRDASGTWKSSYLAHGAGDLWSGGAAATGSNIEYFVQVGDTHGNIGVSSNKAHYFAALPPPPPPPAPSGGRGRIDIGVSGSVASGDWYSGAVQVTLHSSNDSRLTYSVDSGASTPYAGAFSVTGNGFHTIDAQGADGSVASTVALIDGAAPTIVVTAPAKDGVYLIDTALKADYACVDAGSGATRCEGTVPNRQTVGTGIVGTKTFHVDAADAAGHTAALDQSYQVIWPFTGFFTPIANLPTVNQASSGQSVPVKFGLGGNRGMKVFADGFPRSQQVNCTSNASIGAPVPATTPGASSLSYDATTKQYTYVWKTDKAWANTCRNLVLRLADDTEHTVSFKLK